MRILSGIRPSGELHIGNYLGAVRNWVELQAKEECICFVADLQALTTPYSTKELQRHILDTVTAYLAAGIDPEKSVIFVQSHVKEHNELFWLLSTICPVGDLSRMTQYKEKSRQFKNNVNAGLLNYPVLQAADILLYKADLVPVGKDQLQHLELTRTIARKFNQRFGKVFVEPEAYSPKIGTKIMSLQNPKKKMSKSDDQRGCIGLFEEPESIKEKIMAATTDSGKEIKYDSVKKPGISNLLSIYSLFSDQEIKEIERKFKGKNYADLKKSLAELLIDSLKEFRRRKKELATRQVYIEDILAKGARRAQIIAQSTMEEVRKKMGLI